MASDFRLQHSGSDNVIADAGSRYSNNSTARTTFTNMTTAWSQTQPTLGLPDRADLAQHLREHSVAGPTYAKYKRALCV
ncbi:hypothetical protein ON010_g270 [Phytophthora cinnamomi]|nr:hypothetical protein ON010_g270 [Phytophthora cinnamomi]